MKLINKLSFQNKLFLSIFFMAFSLYLFSHFTTSANIVMQNEIFVEYGSVVSTEKETYLLPENVTFQHNFLKKTADDVFESISMDTSSLVYKEENNYPEVGQYNLSFSFETKEYFYDVNFNEKDSMHSINITVSDTTPPIFTDNVKELSTYVNAGTEYESLFVVEDLSETEISTNEGAIDYSLPGEYLLTVTAKDACGNTASKDVVVNVKMPTIKLNKKSAKIYTEQSVSLSAEVDGPNQEVSFKSSNPSVASVNSKGVVSGKGVGTATITASANGVSDTFVITVERLTSIFTKDGDVADSYIITANSELSYLPSNALNYLKNIGWTYYIVGHSMRGENYNANLSGYIYGLTFWDGSNKFFVNKNHIKDCLLHEFGHVIDCSKGRISSGGEFIAAYEAERYTYGSVIPGATSHHVNDLREYFADSFEAYFKWPSKLKNNCPLTYAYMQNMVASL